MSLFGGLFQKKEELDVASWHKQLEKIAELEKSFGNFSSDDFKQKTGELQERLKKGETEDNLLPEAFALVRVAAKKTIGLRHFDVQLIGGWVLHQGKIAEMKTGEGKTLAATTAIYLNALGGQGVHVVTVNDYLAKRDTNWMGVIFYKLGLSVGCVVHDKSYVFEPEVAPDQNEISIEYENLKEVSKKEAYQAHVTYGTNNEFGFDYLRDNMVGDITQKTQRGHHYAIIDEVDSILIDEARTPLIISAPDEDSSKLYQQFSQLVPRLKENQDYNVDEKMKAVTLTDEGVARVEKILGMDIYNEGGIKYVHHLEQALRAQILFKKDRNYVIKEGEVIIVDEFTGRLMPGRRYSQGLHQAIEAKEGVEVKKESRTMATITFQNYFRLYKKLAGMTGTAKTSEEEFRQVYGLEVEVVPTNEPMIRDDQSDFIYVSEEAKFKAIIEDVKEKVERNQAVLIGTASIEKNELLHQWLVRAGVKHEVLNAKNHEREAQIIAQAGQAKAVTVATNMAGRGVDIKLSEIVKKAGGLHVLGTERHEARRIDNQLRGRAGRQGDPGSSRFYLSLEDDLMRVFGPDRIKNMMRTLKFPEDQPIENKFISRAIESAQTKIEGFNFDARRHVLEYDDVLSRQRQTVYKKRAEILSLAAGQKPEKETRPDEKEQLALTKNHQSLKELVDEVIREEITKMVDFHLPPGQPKDTWNLEELAEAVQSTIPLPGNLHKVLLDTEKREDVLQFLLDSAQAVYQAKEKELSENQMREIEKLVLLRNIDMLWMEHLETMDYLKDSVRLRAYGQKDPLVEYKNEGWRLFKKLLETIQFNVVNTIYKVQLAAPQPQQNVIVGEQKKPVSPLPKAMPARGQANQSPGGMVGVTPKKKIGRNDPCPCGATKPDGTPVKYKKCCGRNI